MTDSVTLSDDVVAFLDARNMVSVATTDPDGKPRQTVTWFRLEADGRILINGRLPRKWCANLARDPRVSLAIIDLTNPYTWVGITGVVEETVADQRAVEHIVELANRYYDGNPSPESVATFRSQQRLTYYVKVTGVYEHFDS